MQVSSRFHLKRQVLDAPNPHFKEIVQHAGGLRLGPFHAPLGHATPPMAAWLNSKPCLWLGLTKDAYMAARPHTANMTMSYRLPM
jgi:hypothetical protein